MVGLVSLPEPAREAGLRAGATTPQPVLRVPGGFELNFSHSGRAASSLRKSYKGMRARARAGGDTRVYAAAIPQLEEQAAQVVADVVIRRWRVPLTSRLDLALGFASRGSIAGG